MILLVLFAVVAGAGTALSPCGLPVLPALLASASSGGRRRPLGVIAGLTATFTIAIVALASLGGRRRPAGRDGAHVRGGRVTVREECLYRLVSLPRVEDRRLTLRVPAGVTGYAFTFG